MPYFFKPAIAVAITLATAVATNAAAEDSFMNTKLLLGTKNLDAEQWDKHDDHSTIGIMTDIHTGVTGLYVAVDLLASGTEEETDTDIEGTFTAEAQLGLRKYFAVSCIRPYVGGGLSLAYAAQEEKASGSETEEDHGVGYWVNGGVDFSVTQNVTLGIDVRYSAAEVELYDETLDINSTSAGATLGYRW